MEIDYDQKGLMMATKFMNEYRNAPMMLQPYLGKWLSKKHIVDAV